MRLTFIAVWLLPILGWAQSSQQGLDGFSYGNGSTRLPSVADTLDVAKIPVYDTALNAKFKKAWFAFREVHALTEDGLFVPAPQGSESCPETPESQAAFLNHIASEPVKVTFRSWVKCEDCRGTGKKFVYDGLTATELTHIVCGGTGQLDSLVTCRLSYSAMPPPRLPSGNQRAYSASLKSAEAGKLGAILEVASRLASGRGTKKDVAAAASWYAKALARKEAKAAGELGMLYERGEVGVEMNKPFAVALNVLGREIGGGDQYLEILTRTVSPLDILKGHWYGQRLLALHRAGHLNEASLTPAAVSREVMGGFDQTLIAARRGERQAIFDVGMIQLCGLGAAGVDAPAAFGWFVKSAQAGHPLSYFALGSLYESGVAVRKNRSAAYALYRVSVSLGQDYPATQTVKSLEPACGTELTHQRIDKLLVKVRERGVTASDISGLSSLQDVETPIVASVPTGAPDALGQEENSMTRKPIKQSGSGLIFTADGHVFTNHHVVDQCIYFSVRLNGASTERRAFLIASDPVRDLAILKVYGWNGATEVPYSLPSLLLSAKEQAGLGMKVFTIGFPIPGLLNSSPKYTSGDLNSTDGPADRPHFMQVSCPIQPGNSGGALVLEDGRVAGVVCATLTMRSQNANFATRVEYLRELASKNGIVIPPPSARVNNPIQTIEAHAVQVLCR